MKGYKFTCKTRRRTIKQLTQITNGPIINNMKYNSFPNKRLKYQCRYTACSMEYESNTYYGLKELHDENYGDNAFTIVGPKIND